MIKRSMILLACCAVAAMLSGCATRGYGIHDCVHDVLSTQCGQ